MKIGFTGVILPIYNYGCNSSDTLVIYVRQGIGCKIFRVDDKHKGGANSVFLSP